LTHGEAVRRAAFLRVASYDVELDLTPTGATFASTTVIRFSCGEPGVSTFVDLVAPAVRGIELNGRSLDPQLSYQDSRIELAELAAGNELRVVADCAYMNTGEGLHRTIDPADGRTYLYTHYEIPEARRVFASFEQPDLKAAFTFTVTAPTHWVVLSNSSTPKPEPVADREGVSVWRFAATPRISTYITAIVAGEYHQVHDTYIAPSGQVVPLGMLCRQSMAAHLQSDEIFEVTKQGLDYFLPLFDHPYPYEKYDQIYVPEYNIGAMENVGCITISENYLFRGKVTQARHQRRAANTLHELAHQWFGDLVTMRWWNDLWLKESVATYLAAQAQATVTRWRSAWTAFASENKAWGLRQDRLPSTHPIMATIESLDDVGLNFDGITYAKGAAVLKQLVAWVGADAFFAGLRAYIRRHAWATTTLDDLLAELTATSGRDLARWAQLWLQTAGPNTLRPQFSTVDGKFTSFAVLQEAPAAHPTLRPHRIAIGLYERVGDTLHRTHRVELDIDGERTDVPELTGYAQPDLVLLNDDDLTFAAIRFDERSLSTVVSDVRRLTDSLARAQCWTALWDMVRMGELPARTYLRMALDGIDGETDMTIVQSVHAALEPALRYVDPPQAAHSAAQVCAAARRFLLAAPAGSDLQLAWARVFAATARESDDVSFAAQLLDGSVVVPGLAVDVELRWALLTPLVRAGRADATRIEAELERDRTTAGEEYAAGALAARPLPEAKAQAWTSVVERDDLPNRSQDSVIGGSLSRVGLGFVQSGQAELLEPYVRPYFAAVPQLWEQRTFEIACNLISGLYPRWRAEPDTIEQTDRLLADPGLSPALRRLLVEARDDVERTIRARAADRTADVAAAG
jgi:aminopeptidase N